MVYSFVRSTMWKITTDYRDITTTLVLSRMAVDFCARNENSVLQKCCARNMSTMTLSQRLKCSQVPAKKSKGPAGKKQHLRGKGQKKKVSLKFTIDCTHPVEDNIMDVASFVSCFLIRDSCSSTLSLFAELPSVSRDKISIKSWSASFT